MKKKLSIILLLFLLSLSINSAYSYDTDSLISSNIKDSTAKYPKKEDKDGIQLIKACKSGNIDRVKSLIEKGADVNFTHKGSTPLNASILSNQTKIAEVLIKNGADVNYPNKIMTPLEFAAILQNFDMVKLLVENGANIENNGENSALILMFQAKNTKDVSDMVQKYIKKDETVKIAEYLIDKGADVNFENTKGATPLIAAMSNHDTKLIEILIKKGADVNYKNKFEITPLFYSVMNYDSDIMKLLIDNGADVNFKSKEGYSPLYMTLLMEFDRKGIDFKEEKDTFFCTKNYIVNTKPKEDYDKNKTLNIVKLLVENGADINFASRDKITLLMIAIISEDEDMVKYFVEKGVNVNAKTKNGGTALSCAIEMNQKDTAKLLIENGANVNTKDKDGVTPLMTASGMGNLEIVKCLVENGAKVNARTYTALRRITALNLAKEKGYSEIVEYLKSKGAK